MQLNDLVELECLGGGTFRAELPAGEWRRPFGGHLLAQSLAAGCQTVDSGKTVHNMQTQFLRAGHMGRSIQYRVEDLHEGTRFATRRVLAALA